MVFDKVKEIIVETTNCDEEKVVAGANLKDDLGIDSLDAMELSMALEDAYGITIEEEALHSFVTVSDIVTYIEQHTA